MRKDAEADIDDLKDQDAVHADLAIGEIHLAAQANGLMDGKPYETRGGKKHEVTRVGVSYDDGSCKPSREHAPRTFPP